MKTVVHVNQHIIKKNDKTGERNPVLTVKTYKSNQYAHSVWIEGPCKIVYQPDKPLSCGAKVWLVTESVVKALSPDNLKEKS
jgi:hypothetical protein